MKTLQRKSFLNKATACFFLVACMGVAPVYAISETASVLGTEAVQQAVTVKGVVTDKTGETVIGANVLEKGTTNGVITGIDGDFTLTVSSPKAVLQISYIGYKTQEIEVGSNRTFNVVLEEDSELLEEGVLSVMVLRKRVT